MSHPSPRRAFLFLFLLIAAAFARTSHAADIAPFAGTLKLAGTYAEADANPIYDLLPITVEARVKLERKTGVNVILANGLKISDRHWEIFADKDSGCFSAFLPGRKPAEVKSNVDVADNHWHYVAMTFDGTTVKLYVDGKQVATQATKPHKTYADVSPLTFGYYPGLPAPGDVAIDEVRISHALRPIDGVPAEPFKPDADTLGLWHFDDPNPDQGFQDLSVLHNPVRIEPLPPPGGDAETGKTRWSDMDFGPFFTNTFAAQYPPGNVTHKGIAIRVGDNEHPAAVCFDTDLCRLSEAWTGDFVKISPLREGLVRPCEVGGTPAFGTMPGPGWAKPGTDDFTDPRTDKLGPLPDDWLHYRGLYVNGSSVILTYTVGRTNVDETDRFVGTPDAPAFVRSFAISAGSEPLTALLADLPQGAAQTDGSFTLVTTDDREVGASVAASTTSGAKATAKDGRLTVTFPPREKDSRYDVLVCAGTHGIHAKVGDAIRSEAASLLDSRAFTHGGPARYPQLLETKGTRGTEKGPYQVDTLNAPDDNPWKSFLRFSGFDFFSNGDVGVCSVSGDVWRVSGVDDKLDHLHWRRFATGLYHPLGLKVVDDAVYVLGRDQITRLHDLNGDGEADFYENFNNGCKVTAAGHTFACNLERDPQGYFYYTKGADGSEHGGTVLRVSPDGSKLEVFAKGIRFSNGLCVGPHGEITEADNEGNWVPTSRIDWVTKGAFLGFTPMAHEPIPPTDPGKPIVWMPKNVDNSSGSQCWVSTDRWGPFQGQLLHTSYGTGSLLRVMTETVNGVMQGGVYREPLNFLSGTMRARFNPLDGQLYVCGLRGWQTRGAKFAALQRVRYTGQPVNQPFALHVHKNGVRLTFTTPLDPKSVDADAFAVMQWNYQWTSSYGSRHWSVNHPDQQGFDTLDVKSATLLPDGKTVFIELPQIQRVMTMQITYKLTAADGSPVKGDVYNTIHELAEPFATKPPAPQ